jgi:hypothetical protein
MLGTCRLPGLQQQLQEWAHIGVVEPVCLKNRKDTESASPPRANCDAETGTATDYPAM